ncbi:hypothetical protein CR513_32292, partial [Mucuna pruriens]
MDRKNKLIGNTTRIAKKVGRSQREMDRGTPSSVVVISYHTLLYHPRNSLLIEVLYRGDDPKRRRNASEFGPTTGGMQGSPYKGICGQGMKRGLHSVVLTPKLGLEKNLQEHQCQQAHPKLGRTLYNHEGSGKMGIQASALRWTEDPSHMERNKFVLLLQLVACSTCYLFIEAQAQSPAEASSIASEVAISCPSRTTIEVGSAS